MRKKQSSALVAVLLLAVLGALGFMRLQAQQGQVRPTKASVSSTKQTQSHSTAGAAETASSSSSDKEEEIEEDVYPDLTRYTDLAVQVSIDQQKMTITSGDEVIFKTTVSTGATDSPTPTGAFVIEPERGDFFYNQSSGEGAYYWVSFKDHGIYLFHSIPTDEQGNEIPEEAALLGKPASHGCVRMKREVAKWFYENIPEGISVTIA